VQKLLIYLCNISIQVSMNGNSCSNVTINANIGVISVIICNDLRKIWWKLRKINLIVLNPGTDNCTKFWSTFNQCLLSYIILVRSKKFCILMIRSSLQERLSTCTPESFIGCYTTFYVRNLRRLVIS
jgi:hypothetical protein